MSLLFAMMTFLMPTTVYSTGVQICPKMCVCEEKTGIVTCRNAGYKEIPQLPEYTKQLKFTGNNLGNVSSQTLENLRTLKMSYLQLDACNITGISPDAFVFMSHLKALDLSRNNFRRLVSEVFSAVSKTNITYLRLKNAYISSIPNKRTLCPKTLKELNLGHNRIWYLWNTTGLSHGCRSLENLTLSGNFLRKFNFTSIPKNVKRLKMHSTKLCQGLPGLCKNKTTILPFLSYLDLSHNAFTTIDIFRREGHCLPSLKTLLLDNNAYLQFVGEKAFSNLALLRNLSLRQMDPNTRVDTHAFVSNSLESLRIQMTKSHILMDKSGTYTYFCNCSKLTSLSIQSLNFMALNESQLDWLFSPLVDLKELILKDCGLTNIGFIRNLPQLRRLVLNNNYISLWDGDIFKNKGHFEIIDLSRNHIATLTKTEFPDKLRRTTSSIDLHGNPFDCTYELCEFRHWISDHHGKLVNYPENYNCESPDNLKGTQLSSWLPTEEECRKPEKADTKGVLMESLIIVGCLIVLTCIIGIIIYRKRWNIKYYIYLMRSKRKEYQPLADGVNYVYHAFVAYHYTDRQWIVSHLLPYLESQKKLRVCLHQRDFVPGNFIADNILENMKSSRRIIIVLSNNFAQSEWCQFEALTAYKRAMTDGEHSVILIMLEEVSARNVNGVIKNLLQTRTYVDWADQETGQEMFWSRLDDFLK
nr:Toll-like receptor protein [Mimachlamys nobilis]